MACVFCGKNQLLAAPLRPPFSGDIDPLEYKVFQVRENRGGPGRAVREKGKGGFQIVEAESLTIVDMVEEHPDLVEKIKERLLKIVRAYLDVGIIREEELLT